MDKVPQKKFVVCRDENGYAIKRYNELTNDWK